MPIEVTCPANKRCAVEELDGACCPTTIGKFLDCCEVVPDECGENNNNNSSVVTCEVISVAEYKASQGSSAAAASSWWLCQWTVVATVLVGGWMTAA
jgi:hypothetical protein